MGLKMIRDKWSTKTGNTDRVRAKTTVRRVWYGQYKEDGKWKVIKLTTPMRGKVIPDTLAEKGDAAFEKSRALAQAEFDKFQAERSIKGSSEHLTRVLIESKTGHKVEDVRVDELEIKWRQMHLRNRSENWDKSISWLFRLFISYVKVTYLYEVTHSMVSSFYNSIRKQYAWNTVSRIMKLISGAFADLLPVGAANPFNKIEVVPDKKTESVIHRKPLSDTELELLFETARESPMLYALTITAACTGMRIGDVCNLRWGSVDLRGGFIEVQTRKTGQEVTIPIFPRLREVLETAQMANEDDGGYVFPDAAQMYKENYDGLIRRGKVLFARALFTEDAKRVANVVEVDHKNKTPAETMELIRNAGFAAKKTEKMLMVYTLYKRGLTYRQIERETGYSRGLIAGYLHGIEDLTGDTVVKWAKESPTSNRKLLQCTRQERKVGKRSASLYGWHSLRASFVVAALSHNIPIEVVRRVVGHSTVEMTKEYFNPTKRIMAETFRSRMTGGAIAEGSSILSKRASTALEDRESLSVVETPPVQSNATGSELDAVLAKVARMTPAEREQLKALLRE